MKVILLLLIINIIIIEASYRSCKTELASYKNSLNKCKKEKNNLIQADKDLRTGIYVQDDFIFEIYNNKKQLIGYTEILDSRHHYIHRLVLKVNVPDNNVIFYTDRDYLGLYQFYPIGRYTKKNISLNERTISSIIIPDNYIVYLYAFDNFQGIFKKVTSNITFLEDFNDKTVSFEIVEKNNNTNYYASVYSNSENQQLILGEQKLLISEIKSFYILENYELIIYKNKTIIEVFYKPQNYICINNTNDITLIINEITSNKFIKIILFEDIDYKGSKEVFLVNSTNENKLLITFNSLSSLYIPDGFYVHLFENDNFTGANIILKNNINNLIKYRFNDRTKSIKFFQSNINLEYVIIYTEKYFYGDSYYLPFGETNFNYNNKLEIKSIKIPNNYKVIINKFVIFRDLTIILTEDNNDITNFLEIYIKSIIVIKN